MLSRSPGVKSPDAEHWVQRSGRRDRTCAHRAEKSMDFGGSSRCARLRLQGSRTRESFSSRRLASGKPLVSRRLGNFLGFSNRWTRPGVDRGNQNHVARPSYSMKLSGLRARILSRSFRMPAPIFLATDFQVSIERAGRRGNDIAAQDTEPAIVGYALIQRRRFQQYSLFDCGDTMFQSLRQQASATRRYQVLHKD
jgi:hypothetical protein